MLLQHSGFTVLNTTKEKKEVKNVYMPRIKNTLQHSEAIEFTSIYPWNNGREMILKPVIYLLHVLSLLLPFYQFVLTR